MLSFLFFSLVSGVLMFCWGDLLVSVGLVIFFYSMKIYYHSTEMKISMNLEWDSISWSLILLTFWIILLCLLGSMHINNLKLYSWMFIFMFTTMLFFLLICFSTSSSLIFYISFESSLIPILVLILGWGYQSERVQAGNSMFFYTLFGSLPLFFFIIYHMSKMGSSYFTLFSLTVFKYNFVLYLFMLSAFLIKFPMYLMHLWLLKAHVEAPVSGSMVLAGILLKLGGYGLYRLLVFFSIFYNMSNFFISLSIWGAIYVSLNCLRQMNMKLLIASSSVVHMGFCIIGVFIMSDLSMKGMVLLMLSHGLCSSGLFYLTNVFYQRTSSQSMMITKGMLNFLPIVSLWWFLLLTANMAAPPTINLLSELILIVSLFSWEKSIFFLFIIMSFFSGAYNLYLYYLSQHGFFFSSKKSVKNLMLIEMMVMILHWAPINFLMLNTYILMD